MPPEYVRIVVDRCLAANARAERLAVEAHEQQADVRVLVNIAKRAVHVVAVILGIFERVGSGDLDETGIARAHRTIDVVLIARRDEKESRRFDEIVVLLPELEMEAMFLEAVGDTAPVETILQFAHAVVIEGRAGKRLGHGASGICLRHVLLHSRALARRGRKRSPDERSDIRGGQSNHRAKKRADLPNRIVIPHIAVAHAGYARYFDDLVLLIRFSGAPVALPSSAKAWPGSQFKLSKVSHVLRIALEDAFSK